jgi:hypothetical protein
VHIAEFRALHGPALAVLRHLAVHFAEFRAFAWCASANALLTGYGTAVSTQPAVTWRYCVCFQFALLRGASLLAVVTECLH